LHGRSLADADQRHSADTWFCPATGPSQASDRRQRAAGLADAEFGLHTGSPDACRLPRSQHQDFPYV